MCTSNPICAVFPRASGVCLDVQTHASSTTQDSTIFHSSAARRTRALVALWSRSCAHFKRFQNTRNHFYEDCRTNTHTHSQTHTLAPLAYPKRYRCIHNTHYTAHYRTRTYTHPWRIDLEREYIEMWGGGGLQLTICSSRAHAYRLVQLDLNSQKQKKEAYVHESASDAALRCVARSAHRPQT